MNLEQKLLEIILQNSSVKKILDQAEQVNLPDWYLAAGCITQSVWNYLCGLPIERGIEDYDFIYCNPKTKSNKEKEDKLIELLPSINIELVNQAFVHTWIKEDLGFELPKLSSSEYAIGLWPVKSSSVGVRKENGVYKVYAPYGLEDLFNMVLRPNKMYYPKLAYDFKTNKWKKKWPKLTVIDWDDV